MLSEQMSMNVFKSNDVVQCVQSGSHMFGWNSFASQTARSDVFNGEYILQNGANQCLERNVSSVLLIGESYRGMFMMEVCVLCFA